VYVTVDSEGSASTISSPVHSSRASVSCCLSPESHDDIKPDGPAGSQTNDSRLDPFQILVTLLPPAPRSAYNNHTCGHERRVPMLDLARPDASRTKAACGCAMHAPRRRRDKCILGRLGDEGAPRGVLLATTTSSENERQILMTKSQQRWHGAERCEGRGYFVPLGCTKTYLPATKELNSRS
jgi:hypothetical protein